MGNRSVAVRRYGGMAVGVATLLTVLPPDRLTAQDVRLSGYLQPRFQAVGDSASFFLRRARFALEGGITPWASYRAQVEMRTIGAPATPPSSPLTLSATDLWIKVNHQRWGGTVGQFRVPFSLESLLSSTTLETTERSRIVNAATPDTAAQAARRLRRGGRAQKCGGRGEGGADGWTGYRRGGEYWGRGGGCKRGAGWEVFR